MNVPLKAAFGGLRRLPWLALVSSSVAPLLELGETAVRWRIVMGVTETAYGDIELVDYRSGWGTRNIVLAFAGRWKTFTGNVRDEATARAAIRQLAAKGCPLSERAQRFAAGA